MCSDYYLIIYNLFVYLFVYLFMHVLIQEAILSYLYSIWTECLWRTSICDLCISHTKTFVDMINSSIEITYSFNITIAILLLVFLYITSHCYHATKFLNSIYFLQEIQLMNSRMWRIIIENVTTSYIMSLLSSCWEKSRCFRRGTRISCD